MISNLIFKPNIMLYCNEENDEKDEKETPQSPEQLPEIDKIPQLEIIPVDPDADKKDNPEQVKQAIINHIIGMDIKWPPLHKRDNADCGSN